MLKKRSQNINVLGNENTKCFNQNDVLSDEDDEDDDEDEEYEHNITNEMRKEIEEGERTMRFFRAKTERLEEENRILGNRIVSVEGEKKRLEQRNEELVKSRLEQEDKYINIVDSIVDRFTDQSLLLSIFWSCNETLWKNETRNLHASLNNMSIIESLNNYSHAEKRCTTEPMVGNKDIKQRKEILIENACRYFSEIQLGFSHLGISETWDEDESDMIYWCRGMEIMYMQRLLKEAEVLKVDEYELLENLNERLKWTEEKFRFIHDAESAEESI